MHYKGFCLLSYLLTSSLCLTGRLLSRKRPRDATATDTKLTRSADTLCPSAGSEPYAEHRSPEHGLSLGSRTLRSRSQEHSLSLGSRTLRSRSRCDDKQVDMQSRSSRIFPEHSTISSSIGQSAASVASATIRDSIVVLHHLADRQVITQNNDCAIMPTDLSQGTVSEQIASVEPKGRTVMPPYMSPSDVKVSKQTNSVECKDGVVLPPSFPDEKVTDQTASIKPKDSAVIPPYLSHRKVLEQTCLVEPTDPKDCAVMPAHLSGGKVPEQTALVEPKDGAVMPTHLSAGKVTEQTTSVKLASLKSSVTLRRRLGMTSRTTGQSSLAKRLCQGRDDVAVTPYQVEYGGSCPRTTTKDDVLGRSLSGLDKSFTKLVVGLHQIPSHHRVNSDTAAQTDTGGILRSHRYQGLQNVNSETVAESEMGGIPWSQRHRGLHRDSSETVAQSDTYGNPRSQHRQGLHHINSETAAKSETCEIPRSHHRRGLHCVNSETATQSETCSGIPPSHRHKGSLEGNHARGRRRRMDCDDPYNEVDGKQKCMDDGGDHCEVKDCVVVLRRSQSIEKMVEDTGLRSIEKMAKDTGSLSIEKLVENTGLRSIEKMVTDTGSQSIEKMVKYTELQSIAETVKDTGSQCIDNIVKDTGSRSIEKMLKDTGSSHVNDVQIFSHTEAASHAHLTVSSSSSSLLSSVVKCDEPRRKLSLRKSPRSVVISSSPKKSPHSRPTSSGREISSSGVRVLSRNLNSAGNQNCQLSETSVGDSKEGRHIVSLSEFSELASLSSEIPGTGKQRLKRRKVCLELTGLHGAGSGLDSIADDCIVAQSATELVIGTAADKAVMHQNRVILPQPDPDLSSSTCIESSTSHTEVISQPDPDLSQPDPEFSPSPSTLKHVKRSGVDVCQSGVISQPDPDSWQPVHDVSYKNRAFEGQGKVIFQPDPVLPALLNCPEKNGSEAIQPDPDLMPVIYVSNVDNETVVGQAEVMLQSDPDLLRPDPVFPSPIGRTDFSDDCCTDAMYHMALFSSPETSDLDSTPPIPSSPTEAFPGDDPSSSRPETTSYQQIDYEEEEEDDDDDDDDVGHISDTKQTSPGIVSPQVSELKGDVLLQTNDCPTNVFCSTSADKVNPASYNKLRHVGLVQEPQIIDDKSGTVIGHLEEEILSWSENTGFGLVGHEEVGTKIDSTFSHDKSVKMTDFEDRNLSRCRNVKVVGDIDSAPSAEKSIQILDESSENVTLDFADHNNIGNSDLGSTPGERLLREESMTLVESGSASLNRSGDVKFKSFGWSDFVESNKNDVGSTPREESLPCGTTSVVVNRLADLVVLCPENPPPPRHQVISDLASTCRATLLQSTYDAFCSDAGDLPSRPRCVEKFYNQKVKRLVICSF